MVDSKLSETVDGLTVEVKDGSLALKIKLFTGNKCGPGVEEEEKSNEPKYSSRDGEVRIDVDHVDYSHDDEDGSLNSIDEGNNKRVVQHPHISSKFIDKYP